MAAKKKLTMRKPHPHKSGGAVGNLAGSWTTPPNVLDGVVDPVARAARLRARLGKLTVREVDAEIERLLFAKDLSGVEHTARPFATDPMFAISLLEHVGGIWSIGFQNRQYRVIKIFVESPPRQLSVDGPELAECVARVVLMEKSDLP